MKKISIIALVLLALLTIGLGYRNGKRMAVLQVEPEYGGPVLVSKKLFHNPDSLSYYAALAYKDEDPKGLYVTAAASFLCSEDPNFPDSIYTVPTDEAEIMLLHSAELGYPDAIQLIHCLYKNGCWNHSLPTPQR